MRTTPSARRCWPTHRVSSSLIQSRQRHDPPLCDKSPTGVFSSRTYRRKLLDQSCHPLSPSLPPLPPPSTVHITPCPVCTIAPSPFPPPFHPRTVAPNMLAQPDSRPVTEHKHIPPSHLLVDRHIMRPLRLQHAVPDRRGANERYLRASLARNADKLCFSYTALMFPLLWPLSCGPRRTTPRARLSTLQK